MSISIEEVRHVARLARLELDDAEVLAFQGELNALLGHFTDIQDIDVAEMEPVSHSISLQNIWDEDLIGPILSRDEALKNAPVSKAGLFVVPTIIED